MTRKLTLSLDEKVISRAKRIALERGKSLSKIVEEYFRSIPTKTEKKDSIIDRLDKITRPYVDKLDIPENMDYKEMVREWKYQDYMKK